MILNKTFFFSLRALVLIAGTYTATGFSQSTESTTETGESDVVVLDEIVATRSSLYTDQVNALKSPTPILDVPQSLSIYTADQISAQGFTQIGDLIDYTPGVNMSQGEGHRDAVVFRGVRSTADFFVDGVRDDVQYYRPLYNVEQVEILRGPNALFFGRGGTGGILNRVTKKGVIGQNFNTYQFGIDSFGAADVQVDSNTAVSEDISFRMNAMVESLDNHRDFYDGDRLSLNPTLRFQLADETTLDLSYEYLDHERFIDRGIPTGADNKPIEAFKDIVFGDPTENTSILEAHVLKAIFQHRFSENLKANLTGSYGEYDKSYLNLYASGYDRPGDAAGFDPANPDQVTLDGYIDNTVRDSFVLSGNLIGELATGDFEHTLVLGAEYINTSSDQNRFNTFWDTTQDDTEVFAINRPLNIIGNVGVNAFGQPTRNDYTADQADDTRVDVETTSFFLQDEIALSDHLDLVLGARYDQFDIDVLNVPAGETRSRTDEEVSPRVGLVFKPQENTSIYASYSESFLPRSGEQYANIDGDNSRLNPDEFVNLETGVKWDITPAFSVTAAVFEIQQTSAEVDDNDASRFVEVESDITGFEAQVQGQLTDNWFIMAGYSYLDGEQVDQDGDTGLRPRELPENMFSVWNAYQVNRRFGVGLGLVYQDESFINNSNSAILPSYVRLDASLYYDVSDDLRVQLNVENLTDELYFPHAHSTHQATVGAPINARLSVSGNF